jgi:hypothetical protein
MDWAEPNLGGKPTAVGDELLATVTFTGLPPANSAFGKKTAAFYVDSVLIAIRDYEVFYLKDETNHPGTNTDWPNWFYYWTQTSANYGTMNYRATGTSHCDFNSAPDYPCYLTDIASGAYPTPVVGANANTTLYGIDTFAWVARHEWRHHEQAVAWWGPGGYVAANDTDRDWMPDSIEAGILAAEGGPFDNTKTDTFANDGNLVTDTERNAVFTQEIWTVGSANDEDWANPGMQHMTIGRYDD